MVNKGLHKDRAAALRSDGDGGQLPRFESRVSSICLFIQMFFHNICVSLSSLRASLFADANSSLDLTARRVMRIYSLWKAIISHFSTLNNHMRALILFNLKVQKGAHAIDFMSIRVNLSGLIALREEAVDVNPRRWWR